MPDETEYTPTLLSIITAFFNDRAASIRKDTP